jgi:hypothetical protein
MICGWWRLRCAASGLGVAICHSLTFYVTLLAAGSGPGTYYTPHCPASSHAPMFLVSGARRDVRLSAAVVGGRGREMGRVTSCVRTLIAGCGAQPCRLAAFQ